MQRMMRGRRALIFWAGCLALSLGVALHLPMYAHSLARGHHMAGTFDAWMALGMVLIAFGGAAAFVGALPEGGLARREAPPGLSYEPPDSMRLGSAHYLMLAILIAGLVIDVMKPATLGFVLPGLAAEYGIERSTAALLPFVALAGTVVGSLVWGWLADIYGRRVSIVLATIVFIGTSVCGAMPVFQLNLLMCFMMGASAGGMLPVVYTLLTELMPARSRSWVVVLVGGMGAAGGWLAAGTGAALFEPVFGWRALWLQGFPTGLMLLLLARYIPESPEFLLAQGRSDELIVLERRFGIRAADPEPSAAEETPAAVHQDHRRVTIALVVAGLAWSFVNFGLLLWLPSDLRARGYSSGLANGIIASSALIALPTVAIAALLYSRWSSKWTLVGALLLTAVSLAGTLLADVVSGSAGLMVAIVAALIIGSNAVLAVLLPYAAENYRLRVRGRGTGTVAAASKLGGVAVQGWALLGFVPAFGLAAVSLIAPIAFAAVLVGMAGPETRGRTLRDLEKVSA
jgi:MFS transporter, putative metabolite:H+ symporter